MTGIVQSNRFSLDKIYKILISVLLFFTPLLFVTNTKELFEFPKITFVYILGFLILAMFLTEVVLGRAKIRKISAFPLLFLLVYVISTILSSNVYTSFFGYYGRFDGGLLSILVFFSIYFVLINKFTKQEILSFLPIILLTTIPIGVFSIIQHLGFFGILQVERVYATFGQPNWLAQYFVILLPLCMYLAITSSFMWVFIYILGFSSLWFTYSLGGFVGFVFALLSFFIFIFSKYRKKDFLLKFLLLLLLSVMVILKSPGIFKDKFSDAVYDFKQYISLNYDSNYKVYAEDGGVGEYLGEHKISDPGYIRFNLWKGTLDLIFSSPKIFIFGTGPGTFAYEFQKFRPGSLNYSSEWDFVLNKPHNYYLELWSELGFLGLTIYFLLISYVTKRLPLHLIPGFVGFLITNFFGWPVVYTSLLFWYFISICDAKSEI